MIESISMVSPLLIMFFSLFLPIYTGKLKDLNLFLLINISSFVNYIFKEYIFKPLMGDKSYFIIGKGTRPEGAKGSGIFKSNKLSTSYGMPSGHVQTASVFSTYLITTRLNKFQTSMKKIITVVLVFLVGFVAYGRVYLTKVHTIQQTIVGALIGIALVYIYQSYLMF